MPLLRLFFLIIAVVFSFLPLRLHSQSSLNYQVTNLTNATLASDNQGNAINTSAAPNLFASNVSNQISSLNEIGFDFIFMGRYYTHFVVGTNGQIGLGIHRSPTSILDNAGNDLTPTVIYPPLTPNSAAVIGIFWDRMRTPTSGANIRSILIGNQPNRTRVIEWNTVINATGAVPSARCQLRLYEGSGIVEYVYGNMTIVNSSVNVSASIGFTSGSTDNSFLALQDLSSFNFTAVAAQEPATQNLVNTAVPGNIAGLHSSSDGQRRLLRFSPPPLAGSTLTGFQITEVGATYIRMSWDDTYTNELGYNILVSTDNVNFESAGVTAANINNFGLGNLVLGTTYYVKVIAFTEGSSFVSNTLSAHTSCLLNGTYSIGPGGNFPTLTSALDSMRFKGIAGNVFLELQNDYTSGAETFPITFPKTSLVPCVSNHRVTIRPSASASNVHISGGNYTHLFLLDSANYVVFDGRPGGVGSAGQLMLSNSFFGSVFRLENSSNNKFVHLKVAGSSQGPSSQGGVITFHGTAGSGCDNNKIENCEIFSTTIPDVKPLLVTSIASFGFENTNDSIINCRFHDFATSAIQLSDHNDSWIIHGNSFYSANIVNYFADVAAIKIDANSTNDYHKITGNFFGGTAPNCQGDVMKIGYLINFSFLDVNGKAEVTDNYFRRIRFFDAIATNHVAIDLARFQNGNGNAYTVENNKFGSDDPADSVHVVQNGSDQDVIVRGISMRAPSAVRNNSLTNIRCYSTNGLISLRLIETNSHSYIYDNQVGSPSTLNSIINNGNGSTYGIAVFALSYSANIINNKVCRISSNSSSEYSHLFGIFTQCERIDSIAFNAVFHLKNGSGGVNHSQRIEGIAVGTNTASGQANLIEDNHVYSLVQESVSGGGNILGISSGVYKRVRKNRIHNLYSTNSTGIVSIIGVALPNGGNVENNMISLGTDSLGNSITVPLSITGINGADVVRHNSVYIEGNNVADGVSGSRCYTTSQVTTTYNNIFFNARSNANASSAARHLCVATGVSYIANYNLYYFNGTGGGVGARSGIPYTTLALWQAASGVDANSIFSDPLFVQPGGNSNTVDLHVNTGSPIDAAGDASNTVLVDFDGQIRSNLTPVDIGADAFSTAPLITSFSPMTAATGITVTINGFNFTGTTAVHFGGVAASSFTVVSTNVISAVVGTGASGSVTVITPNGTASLPGFIFIPPPVVSSFTPANAGTGVTVTIIGSNFTGATAVRFGGTAAASFAVVNATTITAVVGAGSSGSVSVTTPGGTASMAGFNFIPAPSITSFTPVTAGSGATVTIAGANFTGTSSVHFGGIAAASFTVVSSTQVTAIVGAGASGTVSVTTPGGTASATGFVFIPLPVISSFTPASGATGSSVAITGSNLSGASNVSFGGTAAASFVVNSATSITAIIGQGASGSVSVTTPGGNASLAGFTFIPSPTITSFNPVIAISGTPVTIFGTNFTGATSVSFGGTAAASFVVNSSTNITAVVGSGTSGSVTVITPGGSASLAGFTFTFPTSVIDPTGSNSPELTVSPNPSDDLVRIGYPASSRESRIRFFDLMGREVKMIVLQRNSRETWTNVKHFVKGVYKISWTDGIRTLRRTFLVR